MSPHSFAITYFHLFGFCIAGQVSGPTEEYKRWQYWRAEDNSWNESAQYCWEKDFDKLSLAFKRVYGRDVKFTLY